MTSESGAGSHGGSAGAARILAALALCEQELDRRNITPAGWLATRLERLRALLTEGRRPRVAALGRRGAGKSSLYNALAGAPVAHVGDVEDATRHPSVRPLAWGDAGVIEWLDTPGLRAGGRGSARRDEVARALAVAPPDVVLLLCQASEVDAGIDDDLADAAALLRAARRGAAGAPALLGVVTKVDELAPPDVVLPPFDDADKHANIRHAVEVLRAHMERVGLAPVGVLPVNAYARFAPAGAARAEPLEDLRWNLDALIARVVALLPDAARRAQQLGPAELRVTLAGAMAEVTAVFASLAARAASGAADPAAARAQTGELAALLVRILRGLSPDPLAARLRAAAVDALVLDGGAGSVVRATLGWLRGRRAPSEQAAAHITSVGEMAARAILDGLSDAALAAALPAPGSEKAERRSLPPPAVPS